MNADQAPSACGHCGIGRRERARRWIRDASWHQWAAPSQEQIKARMIRRRAERIDAIANPPLLGPVFWPRPWRIVVDLPTGPVSVDLSDSQYAERRFAAERENIRAGRSAATRIQLLRWNEDASTWDVRITTTLSGTNRSPETRLR